MTHRYVAATGVVGIVLAIALLTPVFVSSQAPARTSGWTARTPDGQPDLQGFWTNTSYVPLERPDGVTKEFFTKEEAIASAEKLALAESEQTEPGTIPDVHYDFTQFGLDRSQAPLPKRQQFTSSRVNTSRRSASEPLRDASSIAATTIPPPMALP